MFDYQLNFNLNKFQQEASDKIVKLFLEKKNIIIDAICGAGKTEMLLETIKVGLNNNLKIGFACPRRQLLLELYERISKYFNYSKIGLVMGGYQKNNNSNFIFLTCHQLKKYYRYFDLLIIDEIDAYPFYNNNELENDAFLSAKQFIFLSATVPNKYYELVKTKQLAIVTNFYRHHLKKVPEPKVIECHKYLFLIELLKIIKQTQNNPLIIYVASIKQGKKLEFSLKLFRCQVKFIHAKNVSQQIINNFKQGKYNILISTTVLERGITLKKVNVVVYDSGHLVFNETTLSQICGRVGRDITYFSGDIFFLSDKITIDIIECQKRLEKCNEMFNLS